jgi:hypothetical protein
VKPLILCLIIACIIIALAIPFIKQATFERQATEHGYYWNNGHPENSTRAIYVSSKGKKTHYKREYGNVGGWIEVRRTR